MSCMREAILRSNSDAEASCGMGRVQDQVLIQSEQCGQPALQCERFRRCGICHENTARPFQDDIRQIYGGK